MAWDHQASQQDDKYNYGTMPSQVLDTLSAPWTTDCRKGQLQFGFSVLSKEIDEVGYLVRCPEDVRGIEWEPFTPQMITRSEYNQWRFIFYFDLRPLIRQEAALNIGTTIFVCIVLCVASLFFSSDANALVLTPVEQMIQTVQAIRDNPLAAKTIADQAFKREEKRKEAVKLKKPSFLEIAKKILFCKWNQPTSELMETVILEKTIIKLGSLLALGFGEAGANIVSQNMKGSDTSGVDAMTSGLRVDCILGNATISDFSTATEVLQEQVMQFVNQIAEIVHGVVDEFHGAANKNMGDTFLIVWRLEGMTPKQVTREADLSVYAFAKIVGAVHRSNVLAAYRYHPGLQQRLGSDCRVNLRFGMHAGWAIEGAVGSEFKIDASYLSPNVSITTCIEHATRIYSVSILATETVVALCSKDMVSNMRLVDKVNFIGTKDPLELYCIDLDYLHLDVEHPLRRAPTLTTAVRFRTRQSMEERKKMLGNDDIDIATMFEDDPVIRSMRSRYSEEFMHQFNMGYQNYSQGEWLVARQVLSKTRAILGRPDGPSLALLRFMGKPYGYKAPANWTGVRDLGDLESLTG